MEEKVRIVMELDKNVVQTACFLANINRRKQNNYGL